MLLLLEFYFGTPIADAVQLGQSKHEAVYSQNIVTTTLPQSALLDGACGSFESHF